MAKTDKAKKPKASKKSPAKVDVAGFENYESAKAVKETSTQELGEARSEFKAFLKDTGLKRGKNYSKDKSHGKAWSALNSKIEDLEARRKAAIAYMKENKPAKGSVGGHKPAKYNYPAEVEGIEDKDEKQLAMKKFRTLTRAKAKKAKVSVDEYLADPEGCDEKAKAFKKDKPKKKAKPVNEEDKSDEPSSNNPKASGKKVKSKAKPKEPKAKPVKKPTRKKKTED